MSSRSTTRSGSASSSVARTPSELSDHDPLRLSVDLVSAARKSVELMRGVFDSPWLRSRSALFEAIRRYEVLWMPLISEVAAAEESAPPIILPPFDVEWVWFCHTLDPVGYRSYCELKYSKLIGKAAIFDEENEEYALMRCKELWVTKYPTEPLENQFDSVPHSNDPISLNQDLVRTVLQHTDLYLRFAEPYRCELVYLIAAKQRYKRFLHLLEGDADGCCSLIPTSDIALMLLSHQSYPTAYASDAKVFESGLGKIPGKGMPVKSEDVKETKMLWEKAFDQPYEKAGGEIHVNLEDKYSTKLPVYWDVSDADVNTKYKSLSPRFLLEVCVLVRLACGRSKVQPDTSPEFLRLRMIRSHKELKIDKPVSSFRSDSWEKIWHLYPEFGTKGVTLELLQPGSGCFRGNAAHEKVGVHWNELLRAPALTLERELERRVRVVLSLTPPVQAPYLLKCVPDKVTDDSGDMVSDEILKMNSYKPQEGRWLTRTVLDHGGRECFVFRIRVASGFWRRGAEVPVGVKWEDRVTEILQGSWSYVAGSIGRAPEQGS
uniref:GRPD C-terminal domain-containing protein n=1 Tax=Kalanchoe fedtschenkoi TaxID=63787 RepID=A0A7N0U955_KALFE